MEYSTLGGGCFWCIQAVFDQVPGVLETTVGYAGGRTQDPNYEQVCGGDTGHAEVVQIAFDPERIDFSQILDYFWRAHDPT
ncbi:MAG TPA: peptide-methionine (S)-S-oxide reductase, partial [Sediminispirochaeta sp.]|nr:peptide-methionine (S)-S-oxide reductase [Sediminispirochaeta sp.]